MKSFTYYKNSIDSILENSFRDSKKFKKNLSVIMGAMKYSKVLREYFTLYNELESKKLVNDNDYAESKIHNLSLQGKSKYFIINYLIQKGIKKYLINEELDNYESTNPDWEIKSAKIFARKRGLGKCESNREKDIGKMSRAGFNYNIIKDILKIQ